MNILETLHFMRTNKKLTQREILKYVDASTYSKLESGKTTLKFSELIEILNRLSIPFDEFSKYSDLEEEQNNFRSLLEQYKKEPKNKDYRDTLYSYFNALTFSKQMPLNELSNYILIKAYFSSQWPEIPPLSDSELQDIFELLEEKKYFFHYDYAILANTIYLFSDEQIDLLMQRAFPVKDMGMRNAATKEFLANLVNNVITTFLKNAQFEKAHFYLALAKKEKKNYDLTYKIIIDYLENLTFFLQTNDFTYANALTDHINYLTNVGEIELATSLKGEMEFLLSKKKETLFILRNHFNT